MIMSRYGLIFTHICIFILPLITNLVVHAKVFWVEGFAKGEFFRVPEKKTKFMAISVGFWLLGTCSGFVMNWPKYFEAKQ